jgi:5-methyltetrahydropteroyltriglutamate--homocysteine methyltransferase
VLIGPVSYLLLGKEKEAGFEKIDLIKNLLPVYTEILTKLQDLGAEWIQFDEPFLSLDLSEKEQQVYSDTYKQLAKGVSPFKFITGYLF